MRRPASSADTKGAISPGTAEVVQPLEAGAALAQGE